MLETIREFALEQLGEPGRDRRSPTPPRRVLARARAAKPTAARRPRGEHEIVRAEQDNLRAAIDWALDRDPELASTHDGLERSG